MDELDYWRLCDELTVKQAALLVIGVDPASEAGANCEDWKVEERPNGYEPAKAAISNALRLYKQNENATEESLRNDVPGIDDSNLEYLANQLKRAVKGRIVPLTEDDINGNPIGFIPDTIDIDKSYIEVESLREWLKRRGFRQGFFFPEPVESVDFLDPLNPRYAHKLAAAVRAWEAVTDPGKKSPKQALDKWLREHAAEYAMTNDDGQPIENAIEECSKVANWNQKGGATKTLA